MVLFAYDFPHRKTQDFIYHCVIKGYDISTIIAAPSVKLKIPKSTIRSKVRHEQIYHPKEIAEAFNIPYEVLPHNSDETEKLLQNLKPRIGLIAGARILNEKIIKKFKIGIINFHPGLIPEARGLDAMFWSILCDIDLGVTSHLIDEKIDAGSILEVKKIHLNNDDTLFDLSERLYEVQIGMIDSALHKAMNNEAIHLDYRNTTYNKKMSAEFEIKVKQHLNAYLRLKTK